MKNANIFLSSAGLSLDKLQLNQYTQDEVMGAMVALNDMRYFDTTASPPGFVYNRYTTDGFVGTNTNPNTTSPVWVAKQQKAKAAYDAALKTGDLAKVYATVDAINEIRQVMGGSQFTGQTDFDIVSEGPGVLGDTARALKAMGTSTDSVVDIPLGDSWFFTKEAYDKLTEFAS